MNLLWLVLAIVDIILGLLLIAGHRLYERKLWRYLILTVGIVVVFVGLVGIILYA